MGIQHPVVPILIMIMMMLAISEPSNGRNLHRIATEGTGERFRNEFYSRFSQHLSATAPEESENEQIDPVYGVSHRTIPAGPNPLHN
ncbi:CLAVATA3/ESR (CLE)-related protein 14 [Camellia lanceoleosa]|uniref:CLAVATA3/ESR (CLE)-related protein 14 n=1 Tax=Camellia lanceoleosa TaxID=1840588 RepID=A0ACC0FNJ6_9ERIC|nr:CLAVATA3/ESR (CLE)-related protein 14 [Camellia lanceoleosa]